MAGFWDKEELIREVEKSEHSKIKLERCEKGGKVYINLREWYNKSDDLEWRPGKSGITMTEEIFNKLISQERA